MITQERIAAVHTYVEKLRFAPLEWGTNDCCTFCANFLVQVMGWPEDPMKDFRNQYSSREEAIRLLAKGGGMKALVIGILGPPQPPLTIRVGDIGIGDFGNGDCVGICTGHNICAPAIDGGLSFLALSYVKECWQV